MWNSVYFVNKIIFFNPINRKNNRPTNRLSKLLLVAALLNAQHVKPLSR